MPRTIYVDTHPHTGHDSNTGLDPKRPKRTLQAVLAMSPRPGDTVLVRLDSTFTSGITLKTNGVTYGTYALGTERETPPTFRIAAGNKSTGVLLQGSDNDINGWDVEGADYGFDIAPGEGKTVYSGNRFGDIRALDCGFAIRTMSSKTVCEDVSVFGGRILNNNPVVYVGANAFTLWKHPDYPCNDITLKNCYSEGCYAYTDGSKNIDGSDIEIFGGVERVSVIGHVSRESATFCEIGMTPARKETVRDVRFERCLVIHPNGKCLYVNDRNGTFGGDIAGIAFDRCTLIADDADNSPFFIGAGHGDLGRKVSVANSIVVGSGQIYNTGATSWLNTIHHADNVYWRTDDSKNIGFPLSNGDVFRDPQFHNAPAHDYRLGYGDKRGATLGALGSVQESVTQALAPAPALIEDANTTRGGMHTVKYWQQMARIPPRLRVAGMTCYVASHRMTYRLAADTVTWGRV